MGYLPYTAQLSAYIYSTNCHNRWWMQQIFVHDASGAWPNSIGSLPHSSSDVPWSIDMASHCGCRLGGITPNSSNGWMMMNWMIFHKEWSAIGQTPMSIPRPSKGLCKCLPCCHTFITSSFIAHTRQGLESQLRKTPPAPSSIVSFICLSHVWFKSDTIFNSAPLANLIQASTLRYPNNNYIQKSNSKIVPNKQNKGYGLHSFVPDRCRFSSY